jgi:hypothetical protein
MSGAVKMGTTPKAGKSLKDQNRWQVWLVIAANTLFLYFVVKANAIELNGLKAVFTDANNLVSVGCALLITTVVSNFLSADMKARLVFLRWHHALPGHRAFTVYAPRDPRVDLVRLAETYGQQLPSAPAEQNRLWYRLFQTVKNESHILQSHRDFLLLRDYTAIAVIFVVVYGACALLFVGSGRVCLMYLGLLLVQFCIVRQSASNAGVRLVTNVLATVSTSTHGKVARKRTNAKA